MANSRKKTNFLVDMLNDKVVVKKVDSAEEYLKLESPYNLDILTLPVVPDGTVYNGRIVRVSFIKDKRDNLQPLTRAMMAYVSGRIILGDDDVKLSVEEKAILFYLPCDKYNGIRLRGT